MIKIQLVDCQTDECTKAAATMKSLLDETVPACNNFYQFACGNYIAATTIPAKRNFINMFSTIEDLVVEQKSKILNESPKPDELKPFVLAKNLYKSCISNTYIDLEPLKAFIKSYGGWPVLEGDNWDHTADDWDWKIVMKKMRDDGFDTHYIFTVDIDSSVDSRSIRVSRIIEHHAKYLSSNRFFVFYIK